MKRQREEYVPTPEILDLIENGVTPVAPVYRRPLIFEDGDDEEELLGQLAQILAQEEEEETNKKKEPVLTKEEERIKMLDEYYNNHVKPLLIKKEEPKEVPVAKKMVDPLTVKRIAENREHNSSVPSILTVEEILVTMLKYAPIETMVKLQRTTSSLHKMVDTILNKIRPLSIGITSDKALGHYFMDNTRGLLGRMKANAKSIRYVARDDTWKDDGEDKYKSSDTFVRYEKGLDVVRPEGMYRPRGWKPSQLTKIIVNIREASDIYALFKYFRRIDVDLIVHYCPGRQLALPAVMCDRVRHQMGSYFYAFFSFTLIYDPYGHLFDNINNEPSVPYAK